MSRGSQGVKCASCGLRITRECQGEWPKGTRKPRRKTAENLLKALNAILLQQAIEAWNQRPRPEFKAVLKVGLVEVEINVDLSETDNQVINRFIRQAREPVSGTIQVICRKIA